jgi:subtilisin family serine protease
MALLGPAGAGAAERTAPPRPGEEYVPGEVIVRYKRGATLAGRGRALSAAGTLAARALRPEARGEGRLELARLKAGRSVAATVRELEADPSVEYAEPNYTLQLDGASPDPRYTDGTLWGLYGDVTTPRNPYGGGAGEAWAAGHTGSRGVYVGVIDEGVDITHPDLASNIWRNPLDPVDGRDNDGNGRVDDHHGWNFATRKGVVYDPARPYDAEHGTRIAGTIGAANNGRGVVGVNWNVTMIPAQIFPNGGPSSTVALASEALDYFTQLKTQRGLNIRAVNCSWSNEIYSRTLSDAIGRARAAGILVVATASNAKTNIDLQPRYPAGYKHDNVITVAASDAVGLPWHAPSQYGTNYGKTSVDLAAPGASIYSTLPKQGYGSYSGTSFAAPHVTGAVALYAAAHPTATWTQIKAAMLSTTSPTAALWDTVSSSGRLDIGRMLATPPSRMGALAGTVRDHAGRALADRLVSVEPSGLRARTASDGTYRIDHIPAGSWRVSVRSYGHLPQARAVAVSPGAASPASFVVQPGTEALNTTLLGGPWGGQSGGLVRFSFGSNRSGVTYECSLDGGTFQRCGPTREYWLSGRHTFRVRARAASGEVDSTPASRTWGVN